MCVWPSVCLCGIRLSALWQAWFVAVISADQPRQWRPLHRLTHIHAYTHAHTHTHTHTRTHARSHTHTYAHTHTRSHAHTLYKMLFRWTKLSWLTCTSDLGTLLPESSFYLNLRTSIFIISTLRLYFIRNLVKSGGWSSYFWRFLVDTISAYFVCWSLRIFLAENLSTPCHPRRTKAATKIIERSWCRF